MRYKLALHTAALLAGLPLFACEAEEVSAAQPSRLQATASVPRPGDLRDTAFALSPGAGWLDLAESPVQPWCGAVLIGPRTVATSSSCVLPGQVLRFGLGAPGQSQTVPVMAFRKSEPTPDVTLLDLETPFDSALAAPLTEGGEVELRARGVSVGFVPRGDRSTRWTWEARVVAQHAGSIDVEMDRSKAPTANCHGDNGAGIYRNDGSLLGIVVAASGDDACVDSLRAARVPR